MKKIKNKLDIGDLFSKSWEIYKKEWKNFILIGIIFIAVATVGNFAGVEVNTATNEIINNNSVVLKLIAWFLSTYLGIGFIRYILNLIDGKQVKIKEIFYGVDSISHFSFVVIVSIVNGIIIFFGILVFIIPGVIAALGLIFSKYIIIENEGGDVEIMEAIKRSWEMTKGYKWRLLWLSIVLGFFNLAGAILLFVGLIVTVPVSSIVMAYAYKRLKLNKN